MLGHEDTIWDIHEPLSVLSSALYHLEPIGVGTPCVESLTGYFKRLAQKHHLRVVDLIAFCSEQTQENVMPSTTQKLSRIDGITESARAWSPLLQKLTCRQDVQYLSMVYWDPVLNPYRLLRQYHAWCPLCYADWLEAETPLYEPLLWRLQIVDACLLHHRKLVDRCPVCHQRLTVLANSSSVGFCPKCRSWLGDRASAGDPCEADPLAQTVGQLLSLAPQTSHLDRTVVPRVIEAVKQKKRIPYTHFGAALQVGMTALSDIKSGARLPNLDTLVRLAVFSEGALWKATNGQDRARWFVAVSNKPLRLETTSQKQAYLQQLLTGSERVPALADVAQTCGLSDAFVLKRAFPVMYDALRNRVVGEQRQMLQDVLDGDVIVTVTALARQYGYTQAEIYSRFPDLCQQVSQAYHERKLARCRRYLEDVLVGQNFPSLTAICRTLKVGSYYLTQHFSRELALLETKRQQKTRQEMLAIQHALDAALASEARPPSSLNQLAVELGRSGRYLKCHFPAASQALLDRRRRYIEAEVQATCQRIQDTVFDLHRQGIYPSTDRLHAVIGTWMVHGKAYRDAYNTAMTACGYTDIRV
jgi:hypothetical protein